MHQIVQGLSLHPAAPLIKLLMLLNYSLFVFTKTLENNWLHWFENDRIIGQLKRNDDHHKPLLCRWGGTCGNTLIMHYKYSLHQILVFSLLFVPLDGQDTASSWLWLTTRVTEWAMTPSTVLSIWLPMPKMWSSHMVQTMMAMRWVCDMTPLE